MKYLLVGVDYDYDPYTNLGLYLFDDEIPFICNSIYKDGDTIYIDKRYNYKDAEHLVINDEETAWAFSESCKDIELICTRKSYKHYVDLSFKILATSDIVKYCREINYTPFKDVSDDSIIIIDDIIEKYKENLKILKEKNNYEEILLNSN